MFSYFIFLTILPTFSKQIFSQLSTQLAISTQEKYSLFLNISKISETFFSLIPPATKKLFSKFNSLILEKSYHFQLQGSIQSII